MPKIALIECFKMPIIALIECVTIPKIALIECYFFQSYTAVSNTDLLYLSYSFWATYYIVLTSLSAIGGKITTQ